MDLTLFSLDPEGLSSQPPDSCGGRRYLRWSCLDFTGEQRKKQVLSAHALMCILLYRLILCLKTAQSSWVPNQTDLICIRSVWKTDYNYSQNLVNNSISGGGGGGVKWYWGGGRVANF